MIGLFNGGLWWFMVVYGGLWWFKGKITENPWKPHISWGKKTQLPVDVSLKPIH